MTIFASDTYGGANWITIQTSGANLGGPIIDHPDEDGAWYIYANRALCRTAGMAYYSGTPASADYAVQATINIKSTIGSTGVAGRISTTARTYYTAYIEQTTGKVVLAKRVAGTITSLGTSANSYTIGDHTLALDMVGTTIRALVGGVQVVSVVDSSITSAGKAGIRAPVISDAATGKHLDNFVATDTSVPAPQNMGRAYVVGLIGL